MGADLYLPSLLQACHQRYGYTSHLLEEALSLAQGNVGHAWWTESQCLKAALLQHAEQVGEMPPALYDLVTEIADLAQGELIVSTRALAEQIATLIMQNQASSPGEEPPALAGALPFVRDLLQVLQGQSEEVIRHGALWLARCWSPTSTSQRTPTLPDIPPLLGRAGVCFHTLLEKRPQSAVAFLLEYHLLPALERASTDQTDSLAALQRVLEPLNALSEPEATIGTIAPTLTRFQQVAGQLHDLIESLHLHLGTMLQSPAWEETRLLAHLREAREHLDALWQEYTALQPELETTMETLGPLLFRVLPFPGEAPARPALPHAEPSPLQRAIGLLVQQPFVWQAVRGLLLRETQLIQQAVAGETFPVLQAICATLVMTLAKAQEPALATVERSLTQRLLPLMPESTRIMPGVTMTPGTAMDIFFVQQMASVQRQEQHDPLRAWVGRVLLEEPITTSVTGNVLRFWLLVQGEDPLLWAELLLAHVRECLPQERAWATPQEARLGALVEQCQGLLREQPELRLKARLAELQEQLPADSPLRQPAERLQRLAQGQTAEHLREAIASLMQEGQQRQEWPEAERQDFCWLVDLARRVLETPVEQHLPIAIRALTHGWQEESLHAWETGTSASRDQEQQAFCLLVERLAALPEPGPQPPVADPRLITDWRLHLLRTLIAWHQRPASTTQKKTPEQASTHDSPDEPARAPSLLEPLLLMLRRMVSAWCFPPQGYFRDPYNDANTLWIAGGVFWSDLAPVLTKPVEQPDPAWANWLPPEQTDLVQIPLANMRELREILATRELCLPSREQLQRWGSRIIRLDEDEDGPSSLSAWYAFFARRKEQFLAFLDEALAREEPLLCSL